MIAPLEPPLDPIATLSVRKGGSYNAKVVLKGLNVQFPAGALNLLYGAAGAGKSTFLRALAGAKPHMATMRLWGEWRANDLPLGPRDPPRLVHQRLSSSGARVADELAESLADRSRLTPAEQWQIIASRLDRVGLLDIETYRSEPVYALDIGRRKVLALARAVVGEPRALLADELLADCNEALRTQLAQALTELARDRVVILATHDARDLDLPFVRPWTLRDRRRDLPSAIPIIDGEAMAYAPISLRALAPHSLVWVESRLLAGMPRPGLLNDLELDLDALIKLGIHRIVCLEEVVPYPEERLRRRGLELVHLPIIDMSVPDDSRRLQQVLALVLEGLRRYEATAVHCRGGLGRTGLILALIVCLRAGLRPLDALARIRVAEPRFVQSEAQWGFLAGTDIAGLRDRVGG